ncbi:MAG: hydroxymethylbilane synthase [Verrucomicrobiia bacterium]
MSNLIIGTRGSPLALAQTEIIRGLLTKAHPQLRVEVKIVKTSGDQFNSLSLTTSGGKGLFTKEIEEQLLRGEIHLAVHSMKDLPTMLPDGVTIGAVPSREDARDVLILKGRARPPGAPNHVGLDGGAPGGRALPELPEGARVGTSSIRRRAQLLARRPDLQIEEIRGNVGTRLQKLADDEELDAVILAAAGLKRLGLFGVGARHAVPLQWQQLDFDVVIPAVAQGIIACEVRESDMETQELLATINHADTLACAEAERVFLKALGGGCQVPYAAYAAVNGEQMKIIGAKFSPDGKDFSRTEAIGPKSDPHELGERAAREVS